MQQLLNDRRVLVPLLVTAIVIAVGALAIVLLSDDVSSDAGPAASSQPTASGTVKVDIADFKFRSPTVTVKAGGKVSWTNTDSTEHTATGSGAFDTGALQKGQHKTLTFDKPGTYAYICAFHPFMKGTVIVK